MSDAGRRAAEIIEWWREYRQLASVPEWYDPLAEKIAAALAEARREERARYDSVAGAAKELADEAVQYSLNRFSHGGYEALTTKVIAMRAALRAAEAPHGA